VPGHSPASDGQAYREGEANRLLPSRCFQTLRVRAEFLAAARGKRVHYLGFTLQHDWKATPSAAPLRFGFTVTRKVGTATERNRIRRRLREAARQAVATAPNQASGDFVVIGRREALHLSFATLVSGMGRAIGQLAAGGGAPTKTRS
jgi:ribonuclease P protein component